MTFCAFGRSRGFIDSKSLAFSRVERINPLLVLSKLQENTVVIDTLTLWRCVATKEISDLNKTKKRIKLEFGVLEEDYTLYIEEGVEGKRWIVGYRQPLPRCAPRAWVRGAHVDVSGRSLLSGAAGALAAAALAVTFDSMTAEEAEGLLSRGSNPFTFVGFHLPESLLAITGRGRSEEKWKPGDTPYELVSIFAETFNGCVFNGMEVMLKNDTGARLDGLSDHSFNLFYVAAAYLLISKITPLKPSDDPRLTEVKPCCLAALDALVTSEEIVPACGFSTCLKHHWTNPRLQLRELAVLEISNTVRHGGDNLIQQSLFMGMLVGLCHGTKAFPREWLGVLVKPPFQALSIPRLATIIRHCLGVV